MSDFSKDFLDRYTIRQTGENWIIYRDAGLWDRFKTVWHEEGFMSATWFQGHHLEFAKVSAEGMAKGVNILHFLGGHTSDIAGNRAISQTKMHIYPRASVHDVAVD